MYLRFSLKISVVVFLLLQFNSSIAQLKLGDAATQLEKSALLELNGNRQGLLLPRLTDTGTINTLNPPDGMLIYYIPSSAGKGIYIRKTGRWQPLITDSTLTATNANSWHLSGNPGLNGTEKLGSINNVGLNIITNNTNRITITAAGLTSVAGDINISGNTVLSGTLSLNPASSNSDITALLLNGSNVVVKRPLSAVAFDGAIQSINGLTAAIQTFGAVANGTLGFTTSGSAHILSIPNADATTRGFVSTGAQTIAGDKTLTGTTVLTTATNAAATDFLVVNASNQVQKRNISTFPGIQSLNGLTNATQTFGAIANGTLGFTTSGSAHILSIPDADATTRGFVSTGAQTFAGDKTLTGTTVLTTATNAAATDVLVVNASNQVQKRNISTFPGIQTLNTLTATTQSLGVSNTTATAIGFTSSAVTNTHVLNIPDADINTRGVITNTAQTIGGNKTFNNNVVVSGTTQVGSTGTALTSIVKATVNRDVPSIPGGSTLKVDFTVTGATVGSTVMISPSAALPDNVAISYARVRADGIVEVMFLNNNQITYNLLALLVIPAPAIDPPAMDYYITVIK